MPIFILEYQNILYYPAMMDIGGTGKRLMFPTRFLRHDEPQLLPQRICGLRRPEDAQ